MKIYFDNVAFEADHTGPNCFAKRLALQLGNFGHTIADADDYDVSLVFIEPTVKLNRSKPYVQRIDGIWFKPEQMSSGMNDNIQKCFNEADSVIWQSKFDCDMTRRWFNNRLCQDVEGHVISNGVEIQPAALRSEALIELRQRFDTVFCCSSNWHPQKRLRDNIELFKHFRATSHSNSCLIIMGNNPDHHVADSGIFYTGSLRHDLCMEIYSMSNWMIHLAYLDHCPNVVVEAISQGCPVICSSEGGTREMVEKGNGIVIQDEERYDFSLLDYDNPPRIQVKNTKLPVDFRADSSTVDIVKCAKAYEQVLQSILSR